MFPKFGVREADTFQEAVEKIQTELSDGLLKIGIAKEQSEKGAAMLETASGHTRIEEEVWRLRMENEAFKSDGRNDRRYPAG